MTMVGAGWVDRLCRYFGLTVIVVTLTKVAIAASFHGTADVRQQQLQAEAYLAARDVMDQAATGNNPSYFPLGHYGIVSSCYLIATATGIPFAFVIKLPAILADMLIALLLCSVSRVGARAGVVYLLNPVTFLFSAYHGQMHTVASAFGVLALWGANRNRGLLSGIALALAASIRQHFAVLVMVLLVRDRKRGVAALAVFTLVLAVVNIPLMSSARVDRLMAPTWSYGSWGYTMLAKQMPRLLSLAGWNSLPDLTRLHAGLANYGALLYLMWAVVFVLWLVRTRPPNLWYAAVVFFLGLYTFAPGFGIQWLVWVVPFWLVTAYRQACRYLIVSGLFVLGSYWQYTLNAKYGVGPITENLTALTPVDLVGVTMVGLFGVLTWAYCGWCLYRLLRRGPTDSGELQPFTVAAK